MTFIIMQEMWTENKTVTYKSQTQGKMKREDTGRFKGDTINWKGNLTLDM